MRLAWLLVAMAALSACSSEPTCIIPDGEDPAWTRQIGCIDDYDKFWIGDDDAVFARTKTLNWLIDREDGNRTYFIDTERFRLHYYFAAAFLNHPDLTPVGTHAEFNLLNYRRENRRFVLGKLVHYLDQNVVTLEFSAGDTASADTIVDAYDRISGGVYDGRELVYRPVSARQEEYVGELEGSIPVIRSQDVFLGQTYQPLNPGVGYGTLRFRRLAELAASPPAPTDLVILDRVPNDIALVSGIVTGEFQTPLAHVNILSKNRGTPNMALKGAFDDPQLRELADRLVRLEVGTQDFTVEETTLAEAESYWDSLRPQADLVPVADLGAAGILDLSAIGIDDAVRVGAKAANLGELGNVPALTVPLPELPFALPFSHYRDHLEANDIAPLIDNFLADYATGMDVDDMHRRLFEIRWKIYRSSVDPAVLATVTEAIASRWGPDRRLRFRSSTNVEDLPNFSGAGLYTSAAATLGEGDDSIADAIKVVWASAWNSQAFVEREFYRVQHELVNMGVLVHPAFVDEEANGVAVTINSFDERRPAFYINSQVGEVSVTNPTGLAIPEQILYYTWYEEPEYEVITRSSLLAGTAGVMSELELDELAAYLAAIHNHFADLHGRPPGFAMDVEFKMSPGRLLFVKQARPLAQGQ